MHMIGKSTQGTVQAFVRDQNIKVLERALRAEADPDDRRILRRLLREQERITCRGDAMLIAVSLHWRLALQT
jgi:hypothetical protein